MLQAILHAVALQCLPFMVCALKNLVGFTVFDGDFLPRFGNSGN
jgi:hypothetical protein